MASKIKEVMTLAAKTYVEGLLIEHDYNMRATAKAAGVNRTDLYKILDRLGIALPARKPGRYGHRGNWAMHGL